MTLRHWAALVVLATGLTSCANQEATVEVPPTTSPTIGTTTPQPNVTVVTTPVTPADGNRFHTGSVDLAASPVFMEATLEPSAARTLGPDATRVEVTPDGRLLVNDTQIDGVEPLPDAVATMSVDGRIAVLTDPTDRYGHGVLGDKLEAASITILRPLDDGGAEVEQVVDVSPSVVESTSTVWADVDGDDVGDLVATLSNDQGGARQVVWPSSGPTIDGAPIGQSGRWRHLVAMIPSTATESALLVEVVTPHLTRTVTVSEVTDDGLRVTLEVAGKVVSHSIGQRNLDNAMVVDVDGDGGLDMVGPSASDANEIVVVNLQDGAVRSVTVQHRVTGPLWTSAPGPTGHRQLIVGVEGGFVTFG